MTVLEMHLMFCYNSISDLSLYVHFLKALCYIESIKSCLLPFLPNLYCTSFKQPLFKVPRVAANRDGTVHANCAMEKLKIIIH